MSESTTLDAVQAELASLRAQVQRQQVGAIQDPAFEDQMGQPAKSQPEGWHPGATPRDLAQAKFVARGRLLGGLVDPDSLTTVRYATCRHAHPEQCGKCWTKATEQRERYAVGLSDDPGTPLYPPEQPRSQRSNVPTAADERTRTGRRVSPA